MTVTVRASPSLALVKYWGKQTDGINVAATPSLAVTLAGIGTTTSVRIADHDQVRIDGVEQDGEHFAAFFDEVRRCASQTRGARVVHFAAESVNDFPTAAGLASSSSGFAALALACARLARIDTRSDAGCPPGNDALGAALSGIARTGSGSAARAIFGGFTEWRAGARSARQIAPPDHWPQLRIVAAIVDSSQKPIGSRAAMQRTRDSSPFYRAWVEDADPLFDRARRALIDRDIESLGAAMRASYTRMFATMLAADPPIRYWRPASIALLELAEQLRADGVPVYETMDAGPQVKFVTTESAAERVAAAAASRLREIGSSARDPVICGVGAGARVISEEQ